MKKSVLILFGVICVVSLVLFSIFNFAVYPRKYENFVVKYSEEYDLETSLVYAIIKTESNFDSNAKSNAGAMGLMQIMPTTAKWIAQELGEEIDMLSLFDEERNIKYGCFYLKYLFNKFSDFDVVICAYNAGEGAVRNWIDENGKLVVEKINFPETKNYYLKVKSFMNVYESNEKGM